MIDSSAFIAAHSIHRHTHPQHLLVSYQDPIDEVNYVSFVDDHTLPQQRSLPIVPPFIKQLIHPKVVGSSHGLICFFGSDFTFTTGMAVLWNPSIRKSVDVVVPGRSFIGFGVCPVTSDPKIVSITQSWDYQNIETSYPCKVMVYTLSSGKWRNLSTNLPPKRLSSSGLVVITDQYIYWRAEVPTHNAIMSFDLTHENFEVIDLPDSLACREFGDLYTYKLRESLAMLQYKENICNVWTMDHGVQRSFTKLFTIKTPHEIVGFRKTGVPIMHVPNDDDDDDEGSKLVVYEPNSEQNNVLEMTGSPFSFYVKSYMETLLLFGRCDSTSY